jgi:hypothetical protein
VRNYGYNTYNNPFSPYSPYGNQYYSWNNPHYYPINYVKTVTPARPSRALVETYKNNTYDNKNRPSFEKGRTIYSSEQPNQGSLLKRVFSSSGTEVDRASRTFETNSSTNSKSSNSSTTTNSNSGGNSNGYNSTGTSTQTSRPPRKQ